MPEVKKSDMQRDKEEAERRKRKRGVKPGRVKAFKKGSDD
jgi:hypothetical protein